MSQLGTSTPVVRTITGTVLLVEDDHDVRVSIRGILEEEGYTILSVTNGRDALEILEVTTPTPRLILLDLVLPVMDGWELVAQLQSIPRWAQIPVVILSGRRERTPPRRIVDYLSKPIGRETLLRVVGDHCGPPPKPHVVRTGELAPLVPDDDED